MIVHLRQRHRQRTAELSTISDGKAVTMHLVADSETIDRKARAVEFAKRK